MTNPTDNKKIHTLANQCLSVRLRLLNRMVNSIYDKAMRPYGVKSSQMNILVSIAYSGEITSKELCSKLQMDTSTFSRTLTRLRNNQWLTSEPSGEGKILNIRISQEGLNKIEEVFPAWEEAQKVATDLLGDTAVKAISKAGAKYLIGR